nr:serine/threonine-protein kinase, active site protein [Tanacetum cinerariifolium]
MYSFETALLHKIKSPGTLIGYSISLYSQNRGAISVEGSSGEYRNAQNFHIPFKEIELAMGMFENSSLPPPIYSDLYTAELSERWPNRTKHGAAPSTITTRSLQYEKLEDLLIPLKEINLATRDFSKAYEIGKGGFGVVYQGRLSEHWKNHDVAIKRLDKTGDEMILVYEYADNGSLDYHLEDKDRRRSLTWVKRLKICLGAAKGLEYLHTGLGEDNRVIHRDVKSGNILLDENIEAKICDFGLSKSDSAKQQQTKLYTSAAGTNYYTDPIYHEGGILRPESDVYSFGVVMFEMLSGMLAWHRRKIGDGKPQPLINLVRRYYNYGKKLLIDHEIKDQIDNGSFQIFIETAYQCISFNSKERPTMETIADKIEEALDLHVKKDVSGNAERKVILLFDPLKIIL